MKQIEKNIQYEKLKMGSAEIEMPLLTEESKAILEMNYNNYINVLAEIIVDNAELLLSQNFKSGRCERSLRLFFKLIIEKMKG